MKRIVLVLSSFVIIMLLGFTMVFADDITSDPNEPLIYSYELETNKTSIVNTFREDIIKWRYKTINGHLYRRKFNYTKKIWIGNWERV